MKMFIAGAFSKNGTGGNIAAVCLLGEALTQSQKAAIAKDLGYSETAYVSTGKSSFKLEYFTPTEEVPLCGHATIAAFLVMREKLELNKDRYIIETKSGDLAVTLEKNIVFMEQNTPVFSDTISKHALEKCFDIEVACDKLPIKIGSTGLRDIILPVKSLEVLEIMKPNFDEITAISRTYDVVGVHAFSIAEQRVVCRNFAPLYGIPEESATGTSNCVLAGYLWRYSDAKKDEYVFEQGYALGKPSEITVRLSTNGDEITGVSVGGTGYLIEEKVVEV